MEAKGQKFICNVKTQCVYILGPSKHVLFEYESLLVKTNEGNPRNALTRTNYGLFCDHDIVLGLKCFLPMLELVQSLSKMVQARGTFNQSHFVQFVYHVCRPSQKVWQPLISNLQDLGEPYLWCSTYCVVVGTIGSNWTFDIQVS